MQLSMFSRRLCQPPPRRCFYVRLAVLFFLVGVISLLHYQTTIHTSNVHEIYRRLYYIPIVLGGLWFTLRGGVLTSLAVSLVYLPHVIIQWQNHPMVHMEQYLEIILYNVIGFLTGYLAQRERAQKIRYQKTADRLEKSYAQLKTQSDQLLEIEEQLHRADRLSAIGQLTAGLAHEIRNPLGSIRMAAEVVQEGIDPEDKRYEFSQILIKEVARLNQVVEEFLQFARPSPPDKTPVDLNRALQDVLQLIRQPAKQNHVTTTLQSGNLPPFLGEQVQLKQAFLNLALNAVQAMPEGGNLTVRTESDTQSISVHFTDTGTGIEHSDLKQIFNPFFTRRKNGTGLGLAITFRIIQGHGGHIEVQSTPGRGSTFSLSLPLKQEPA